LPLARHHSGCASSSSGGRLAGLTAARRLAERGHEVVLCEAQDTLGGRVRSRTVEGFTLDRGFQVCFTAYPAVRSELDLDALDPATDGISVYQGLGRGQRSGDRPAGGDRAE
jgi:phytoene dehydrogenase-like protein